MPSTRSAPPSSDRSIPALTRRSFNCCPKTCRMPDPESPPPPDPPVLRSRFAPRTPRTPTRKARTRQCVTPGQRYARSATVLLMNRAITPPVVEQQHPTTPYELAMQFTSAPCGARLARRLVSHRLDGWGHPFTSTPNETVTPHRGRAHRQRRSPRSCPRPGLSAPSPPRCQHAPHRGHRHPHREAAHDRHHPHPAVQRRVGPQAVRRRANRRQHRLCAARRRPGKTVRAELDLPAPPPPSAFR